MIELSYPELISQRGLLIETGVSPAAFRVC